MQQSPSWEANGFSASQEFPRISRNSNVNYRHYKCPPPVRILSQLDPVHNPTSPFWRSIFILPSHLRLDLLSGLFPSGFNNKTLNMHLLSPTRDTCPVYLILPDFITRKNTVENILNKQSRTAEKEWSSSLEGLVLCANNSSPSKHIVLRNMYR